MNNCDNKEGGSSSNIQTIEETTKLGAAVTAPTSSTTTTSETSVKTTTTNVDKPDDFSNNSNENLINSLKFKQENDTKCAENTNETPACVAGVIAPPSSSTKSGGTTVSYAAITAMDTASANAFISSQRSENSCLEAIVFSHCDKSSTQTICDNESTAIPVPELETTSESPAKAEAEVISGEGNRDGKQINEGVEQQQQQKKEDKASAPGLVVVNASSSSSSSSPSPALSSTPSSASSLIVNLENNKEKTKAPPLENISTTSVLSALSGSTDSTCSAIATNSGSPSLSDGGCYNKNQMLLQKKIQNHHTLTAVSSEPILMQCGSSGHNKTVSTVTGSGLPQNSVITRRVSFPKSDEALVTGYLEPANPWEHVCMVNSISEVAELYVQSCKKHNTTPIQSVLDHLKIIELNQQTRQPNLLLKNTKLMPADCEALEEIFKRVQYKSIDVSSCDLNEAAASALFDMFEYYEVTNELDISSNADGMTQRGWTSCIYMVSHSRALQMLNAQGNPLSKNCADNLGSALNSSNLHTIKLEHCGLRGFPLDSLCTKLRNNQILKELWLAHNDLTCMDADKIAQLLRSNHFLQLIDISNNNIKDEGLMKIVKALIEQSTELERQKIAAAALAFAISEAEHKKRQQQILNSSNNSNSNASNNSSSTTTASTNGMGTITDDDMTSGDSDASPAEEEEDDDDEDDDDEADDADVDTDANDAEDDDGTTTEDDGGGSRADEDDDDEDTVKTSTLKTTPPLNGQSKLDKLLSMNNSDSSEEAPTDTVAASDISVSDDIFDSTNAIVPVVASTPIVEPALELPVSNNNNNTAAAALFDENNSIEDAAVDKAAVTPTKALDVNKNATKLDDFDDTHSTDSAFESSSDGDISRHLPDEFVGRFDNKDEVETAVIATEALTTPTQTPPLPAASLEVPPPAITTPKPIEVTPLSQLAASASPNTSCESSSGDMSALKTAALTGTSPSPASGMRRTESTCTITQSTRVRSHSSDSLSSDNSLDGSIGDAASGNFSTKINEKLTKNDTLTRQKQFDVPLDSKKTPNGLKALALWNNNLTKESGPLIADLLATTVSLELLNIGKNILCNDFVASIRDSLSQNTTLTTLGLQSAHLSCAGIRTLSSILQFGGNSTLQRIDIRDNKIEVDSLNMLAEALKSNTTVTQIDIDDEPKRLSIGSDAQLDYARVLENVRSLCSRNENQPPPTTAITDKTTAAGAAAKRRGGYYLGSRKISLTCHTAPPRAAIIDQASNSTATSKLEVKKKTGVRLRSPIPSPPTISPSSSPVPSPSKSRFQVFRVSEVSPLTSPMTPSPSPSPTPSPTPLSTTASGVIINSKDSTTTIKRLSTSPRSRFHVSKIYEDPGVPILHRTLPPITPSPSPPTAPSIKLPQLPPAPPLSSRTFEKQTIVTTPATPPIEENVADTKTPPSFAPTTDAHITTATNAITATTIATTTTNNSATDTKTNPNSIDVNNSTNNTVKPNDQVDASASVQPSSPSLVHASPPDEATKCQQLCSPPLPVVEDDQRTLTNSPDVNIDPIAITTLCSRAQYEFTTPQSTQETQDLNESQELQSQPASAAAARTRKTSWIPNSTYPGTVDRLLSMFQNPAHLFHRSSSPETISGLTGKPDQERGTPPSEADQQSLVPVRKRTPPAANQLPSWCKLGTEMCKPVTAAIQTAAAVSSGCGASGTTTAVVASVESPLSFFDAASKQFRQSIQVFRQNIAFGNEATNINQEQLPQQLQHDCDTIPSDMKLEIKENISPEHTINEEQLQSLQKIGGSPGSSSTGSSGTDTTEGASTTSSSPSSLLSVQLMGVPSTPTASSEAEKVAAPQQPTPSPPPPAAPAPQTHVQNEEQSCTS